MYIIQTSLEHAYVTFTAIYVLKFIPCVDSMLAIHLHNISNYLYIRIFGTEDCLLKMIYDLIFWCKRPILVRTYGII